MVASSHVLSLIPGGKHPMGIYHWADCCFCKNKIKDIIIITWPLTSIMLVPWHQGLGCLGATPVAAADEYNRDSNDAQSVTVARSSWSSNCSSWSSNCSCLPSALTLDDGYADLPLTFIWCSLGIRVRPVPIGGSGGQGPAEMPGAG
jgi:hypothetical protein